MRAHTHDLWPSGLAFEAPEDGGAGEAIDQGDPGGAVGDPQTDAWAPSRDEWEQTQRYLQATAPVITQMYEAMQQQGGQQQGGQEQGQYQYDPFDERSVAEFVQQQVALGMEQARGEMLGPLEPLLGHIAETEGERMARAELDRITQEIGEFDQDQAVMLAQGLIQPGVDPSHVLRYAAQHVHAFEERIRADERAKYEEFLREKGGAPNAAGAAGGAAYEEEGVPTGRDKYVTAVNNALARRRPVTY